MHCTQKYLRGNGYYTSKFISFCVSPTTQVDIWLREKTEAESQYRKQRTVNTSFREGSRVLTSSATIHLEKKKQNKLIS